MTIEKLNLVDQQIQQFIKELNALLGIFDKMESFCTEKKIETKVLVDYRLAPDQFPFKRQIQLISDTAKFMAARLANKQAPVFTDDEESLEELRVRVAKTIDYLKTLKPEQFQNWTEQKITVGWMPGKYIPGKNYLFEMAVPNFYFHMTTAYSILRHAGVNLGKTDFLGELPFTDA